MPVSDRLKAEIAAEVYLRHRDRCPGCKPPCGCRQCPKLPRLCERGAKLQSIANETAHDVLTER
jgi:hypothetical protein